MVRKADVCRCKYPKFMAEYRKTVVAKNFSEELRRWFVATEKKRRRFWTDPVGVVIRTELSSVGRWKKLGRGKPRRAGEVGVAKIRGRSDDPEQFD